MTTEELLSVLKELANNADSVLYDWDIADLTQLHTLARDLTDMTRNVIAHLIALTEDA